MKGFWDKVGKTLQHHGHTALRTLRSAGWTLIRPPAQSPVFVVGCSRAGTTLVYKTLSQSRELGSLQRETHDFWVGLHPLEDKNWDTHALRDSDASPRDRQHVARYFYAWTGRHRWVDKNNQNGLCVPYLHALFPDAVFVYIKRNPGDNLNSLIEGWGKGNKFSTWSADLPAKVEVDEGRYTRWCFFLAEGWRDYLHASIEAVAAFQYEAVNRAILDANAGVPPGQWAEVFYEDLVRDPVLGFGRIFESCRLEFTPELREHCRNVLKTPYDAFGEIKLDKWKDGRNRARVERALPAVRDIAARMGYPLP